MNSDGAGQPKTAAGSGKAPQRVSIRSFGLWAIWAIALGLLMSSSSLPRANALTRTEAPGDSDRPPVVTDGEWAVVTRTVVSTDSSWTSWFGAPARRVVTVEISNVGSEPLDIELGQLSVEGRGTVSNLELLAPEATINPGDAASVAAEFSLPWFAVGQYDVTGEVTQGADVSWGFDGATSQIPWGLVLVPLAIIAIDSLFRIRRQIRRRIDANAQRPSALVAAPPVEPLPEPATPRTELEPETETLVDDAESDDAESDDAENEAAESEDAENGDAAQRVEVEVTEPAASEHVRVLPAEGSDLAQVVRTPLTPLRAIIAGEVEAALEVSPRRLDDPHIDRGDLKDLTQHVARDAAQRISNRLAMTSEEQTQMASKVESTLLAAFGADWSDRLS